MYSYIERDVYTHMCVYIYIERERDIHMNIDMYVYICIYVVVYIYIYIYIYIHTYMQQPSNYSTFAAPTPFWRLPLLEAIQYDMT